MSFNKAAISSIGNLAPVSLLTVMIETRRVFSLRASSTWDTVTIPSLLGAKYVTSNPSSAKNSAGFLTEGCSTPETMICPFSFAKCSRILSNTKLFPSEPELVKIMASCGDACNSDKIVFLTRSIFCFCSRPIRYTLEGFPKEAISFVITSNTSGLTGVVAA